MKLLRSISNIFPSQIAYAHCDIPCGVYDPASARIAAEGAAAMIQKILHPPEMNPKDPESVRNFHNSMTRYVLVKEEQAQICKEQLLILWTDYFKEEHLKMFPNLHETFWKATKLCSEIKRTVSQKTADDLMKAINEITEMFEKAERAKK